MSSWMDHLATLWSGFQVAGVLSVIAWLTALAALAVFAFSIHRAMLYLVAGVLSGLGLLMGYILAGPAALGAWAVLAAAVAALWRRLPRRWVCAAAAAIALAGVVLGEVNSRSVARIRIDRTRQLAEARRRQEAMRAAQIAEIQSGTADIRFAEDAPADRLDLAGKTATQAALLTERSTTAPAAGALPDYRNRGKQTRDAAGQADGSAFAALSQDVAPAAQPGRAMEYWDWLRTHRLDQVNLFAVRFGLLVALLMLATDYLSRFNLTFAPLVPLPIAGRWVDALYPKTRAVYVEAPDAAGDLRAFAEAAIRKGETFICFTEADPWRDAPPRTARNRFGRRLARLWGARADGTSCLCRLPWGFWPVGRIVLGQAGGFPGGEFVFESAWFGRYCFVVEGAEPARRLLADLLGHLDMRRRAGASARRTVNLVWALDGPPQPLDALIDLCGATNFKLLVWSASPPPAPVAAQFDERRSPGASAQPSRPPQALR